MKNWKRYTTLFLLMGLLITGGSTLLAQTGGSYALTWSTVDGGGGTLSGGSYTMSGTAGQADATTLTSGSYTLAGGFWYGGDSNKSVYLPFIIK
jgi:hypothetical protein